MHVPQQNPAAAIGFDIGGTKIEAALVARTGELLATLRRPTPPTRAATLDLIAAMTGQLGAGMETAGVGFSIPGSIDPASGLLRNAPNSPAIDGTPFAADIARLLPMPVAFENDANCLLLSEARFGAAQGYRWAVGLILGTGVGGAVLHRGELFQGSRGLAPEPGHLPLSVDGRLCGCGNRGCTEAYLSGPALLKRYHEAGGAGTVTDTRDLFTREHDAVARAILEETAELFARFMAALISLYDPQVFVLGGGLSLQPFYYRQEARIAGYAFGTDQVPPILPALHGDASGKLGAAALIFDRCT